MFNKLLICLSIVAFLFAGSLEAQVLGGRYAYAWLSTAQSAQTTALGGWQLRYDGRDPALAGFNPAALNANTDRVIHASQDFMNAGIGRSIFAGAKHLDRFDGDASINVQYVGYGEFAGRDERNNSIGDFKASEYAIGFAFAKTIDERLHLGAQVQLLGGSIEAFNSMGAAFSAGLMYTPDSSRYTVWGLQIQNAGYQWNSYTENRDPLPFEVSFGVSRRLRYLPLRFGVLFRRLDRWDLLYDDPDRRESDTFFGDAPVERGAAALWIDNFSRHLAFNAELYLGKAEVVQLRLGYDRQRQQEMKVGDFRGLAGFSFGFGLNLRKFRIDYGRSVQHLGGGPNHVGVLIDLGS